MADFYAVWKCPTEWQQNNCNTSIESWEAALFSSDLSSQRELLERAKLGAFATGVLEIGLCPSLHPLPRPLCCEYSLLLLLLLSALLRMHLLQSRAATCTCHAAPTHQANSCSILATCQLIAVVRALGCCPGDKSTFAAQTQFIISLQQRRFRFRSC